MSDQTANSPDLARALDQMKQMRRRGPDDFGDWRMGPETIRHGLQMAEKHNANKWGQDE